MKWSMCVCRGVLIQASQSSLISVEHTALPFDRDRSSITPVNPHSNLVGLWIESTTPLHS